MPTEPDLLHRLDRVLDGARLWGVELDTRYRVAAATFEPDPDRAVLDGRVSGDVQVVLHPVAEFTAALRRQTPEGLIVETFEVEHLVAVVDSFDGARVRAPLFDQPPPDPGEWGPQLSLQGRTQALDGRAHALQLRIDDGANRSLDLRLTFDDVVLRDAGGEELPLS